MTSNDHLIDDNANAYLYDGESRVVRSSPQSTTNHTSYKYDAGNRRVKKETASGSLHYIWEGSQVIGEYNASTGTMIAEYVYLGGRLIARENAGGVRYYHQDRLSVRVMTNGSGSWAGTQSHEPFGEEVVESGEQSKQRFTSYERDAESGTDYAVNRQYSYATGRFMRPDPIEGKIDAPQSLNRYAYVSNDPINSVDPLGLLAMRECNLVSTGVVGFYGPDNVFYAVGRADLYSCTIREVGFREPKERRRGNKPRKNEVGPKKTHDKYPTCNNDDTCEELEATVFELYISIEIRLVQKFLDPNPDFGHIRRIDLETDALEDCLFILAEKVQKGECNIPPRLKKLYDQAKRLVGNKGVPRLDEYLPFAPLPGPGNRPIPNPRIFPGHGFPYRP